MTVKPLLLASSSPYRKALLERLQLPFICASPDIDETPFAGETAEDLAVRLAEGKAEALVGRYPGHLIIGSDQVAELADGTLLNKPGDHAIAQQQLAACSGQSVLFHTGLALTDADSGSTWSLCEPFRVHFRDLDHETIDQYLSVEQPYDCAGSFRMEGLGIALFRAFEGRDPNSLIGLPLIALVDLLKTQGIDPIAAAYRNSRRD
ncbi:septum formation inhibitor Maf [Marinobacter sp. R17]|uniref:Maf family protein n=1 Tax=Marinobacter sp. R17 TaxID=2484250 RepID=UPI000F4B9018|nr:Maf family nucleotide pyrophosphatase [Marinobacter sp. R17]ROU01854.1 septum formation inhibitor Maf [Marinobacter sp. R17]